MANDNRITSDEIAGEGDDRIVLSGANGQEIEFTEIAGIAHKGKFYAILQPVKLLEGMNENEAIVFEVTRGSDGRDNFQVCLDDEIINAVFKEYLRLLDEE